MKGSIDFFAQWKIFDYSRKFEFPDLTLYSSSKPRLSDVFYDDTGWEPIRPDFLRYGPGNQLPEIQLKPAPGQLQRQNGDPATTEQMVVENVYPLAHPRLVVASPEYDILFGMYDDTKPWYAAGDILQLRDATGTLELNRVTDDLEADMESSVIASGADTLIAAWTRITGDVSDASSPEEVYPHVEIMAATFDRVSGAWSVPAALTNDASTDRSPVAVHFGDTDAAIWIENATGALIGAATAPDSIVWSRLEAGVWSATSTIWTATAGIVQLAFVEDRNGEGYLCFTVDEDGDLATSIDRELYSTYTIGGAWSAVRRLTNDDRGDELPVLIAPDGVAMVVWSSSDELRYGRVAGFVPRPVFVNQEDVTQGFSAMSGTALPGSGVVAYAAQGTDTTDIYAAFYDSSLNLWSQPRQLTHDESLEELALPGHAS